MSDYLTASRFASDFTLKLPIQRPYYRILHNALSFVIQLYYIPTILHDDVQVRCLKAAAGMSGLLLRALAVFKGADYESSFWEIIKMLSKKRTPGRNFAELALALLKVILAIIKALKDL